MGANVNIRHIITNKQNSINKEFTTNLLSTIQGFQYLQSNIYYKLTKGYLRLEYESETIPDVIYNNDILINEDIITIYSSDLSNMDSYVVFDNNWDGSSNYKPCFYQFDTIELIGDYGQLNILQEYAYRKKQNPIKSNSWQLKTKGKLFLHTSKSIDGPSRFNGVEIIEEDGRKPALIENEYWITKLEFLDKILDKHFEDCLKELFIHPEYYDYKIESVRIIQDDKTIVKAEFDKEIKTWKFYENSDLWQVISNSEITSKLKEIGYYK